MYPEDAPRPAPICRMAARLWRDQMEKPEYNQLGHPKRGSVNEILAESLGQRLTARIIASTTADQLDRFEGELARLLMTEFPFREKDISDYERGLRAIERLNTDYHPDTALSLACQRAGLPKAQVPIKSMMHLDPDRIGAAFGYGAPWRYWYPLGDNRWLVTSLQGQPDDIERLKQVAHLFTICEGPGTP